MKTLPLGVIASDATPPVLLVLCLALLTDLSPTAANRIKARPVVGKVETGAVLSAREQGLLGQAISATIKELNHHTPVFSYCGHHPTGDQLGVWVDLNALHQAETAGRLTQVSGPDWSGVKSAYVLDIGGEGLTLYRRRGRVQLWHVA